CTPGAKVKIRSTQEREDMEFDWHADEISRATPLNTAYKSTQNVRRFLRSQCGEAFKFDRPFMAWIRSGAPKTMGDVADEWTRRQGGA
ncbi:MAG: hypothetical protein ACI83E_003107, partial [Sulfitobacter sp.]